MRLNAEYPHNRQTSLDATDSLSSTYKSESSSDKEGDDMPAQKKQKIDNPQARPVVESPQAVDDPISECSGCRSPYGGLDSYSIQDPFDGQDPFYETLNLLATLGNDEPTEGRLKEDGDGISAPQSHGNDRP